MKGSVREPTVAGMFYPSNSKELLELIDYIDDKESLRINFDHAKNHIIGGVIPHAGYIYSGYQAVHFFKILKHSRQPIDTIIILNPNHNGYGPKVALDSHSFWNTPLGNVEVDKELSSLLGLPVSAEAHKYEHSGEVMIPLIQYYFSQKISIVPVCMLDQSYVESANLAEKIFKAISKSGKNVKVIASTDFSHFLPPEEGQKLDKLVIDRVLEIDAPGVYRAVKENNISVCGYGPIMTLIEYSQFLTKRVKAKVLCKGHSGEVSPSNRVVDYVSMIFYE